MCRGDAGDARPASFTVEKKREVLRNDRPDPVKEAEENRDTRRRGEDRGARSQDEERDLGTTRRGRTGAPTENAACPEFRQFGGPDVCKLLAAGIELGDLRRDTEHPGAIEERSCAETAATGCGRNASGTTLGTAIAEERTLLAAGIVDTSEPQKCLRKKTPLSDARRSVASSGS